jgi:glutathionylspermidine synthase
MKYEVKQVKQASEIRQAYQTAVETNKKYYRAISESGKIYGMVNGHHEIANDKIAVMVDGEYWFENDKYVEPVEQTDEEVIEEAVETINEMVDEMVDEVVDETNYKKLYEEEVAVNKEIAKELNAVKQELQKVKGEFADYKAIVEAFKKL